ncbi:MAG TPA: LLM class flavin-dependent oxidoreductase, partial [Clostridiales bacterium]|nr:LLM class flavin-dependent oxidoreductase [Clostridiales bacterium]
MFSQYFGNYLLNRGIIKPEQLTDALEYQRSVHLKLGVIAVNAGYMTPAQVEEIHNMQKKADKRFGELAIEKGYITGQQLEEMLATQRQGHLMLGQALIDRGHLTIEQLQKALDEYKNEYGMSTRQFNVVRKDDSQEIEQIFRDYGEALLGKMYSDYVTLLMKNLIRFVDDNPTIEVWTALSFMAARWPLFKFGPMVLGQSYRNPALMAKMAATLQILTGGRLIFGLGAGWKEDEYHAYNWPFPSVGTRLQQLDEALEIIKRLWTQSGPVTWEGKHYK